ncbi:MAG: hypothetical protein A4E53_01314 [Pelotomaculum sp. PtaB.Bin104]|nr:MAG: hypothetical protein A4E53_01314 [Pelotomaculum sp. PtaB.Bin104]
MEQFAWLITAVIAWVIFFMLIDWSRLKYTIWGGFIVSGIQLLTDIIGHNLNLYHTEENALIVILKSPIFFTFGIVFVIGVLIAQNLPNSRLLQFINILVLTSLFALEELLFTKIGVLRYEQNYIWVYSVLHSILVFSAITWIVEALSLNRLIKRF